MTLCSRLAVRRLGYVALILGPLLAACVSADPALVARAVNLTLTAAITPTPIVVVVTALGGGAAPIPTLTPVPASPTSEPTSTPSLTPTPAPPVPVGAVLFEDDFTQPHLWNVGAEDDLQRMTIADGQLSIRLKVPDRFTLLFNTTRRARDFYASVRGSTLACGFRDRYGLLFRLQDDQNYYQFDVDCDGRYRLSKMVAGTLTPLRDWTASPALRAGGGAANELGVRAVADALEVFANGQALLRVTDSTFPEGGFGMYAGSGNSSTYLASFDDLRIWEAQ